MSRWKRSASRWPGRAAATSGGSRERRAPREASSLAYGPRPVRGQRLPRDGDPCTARPAHGVPRGAVSERRGVLGGGDGDRPHPGGHLHAGVRILQRRIRAPGPARPRRAGARRCGSRRTWLATRRRDLGHEGRPQRRRGGAGRPRGGGARAPRPDVLAHNVETVPRLYPEVRPRASYERSLALLSRAHALDPGLPLKSGVMVGFGETREEVGAVMEDLFAVGCRSVTVGQYLPPSRRHPQANEYLPPEAFAELAAAARGIGFPRVACGPLVRSSYRAGAS